MDLGFGAMAAGPLDSDVASTPGGAGSSITNMLPLLGAGSVAADVPLSLAAAIWIARKIKEKLDSGERLSRRWLR